MALIEARSLTKLYRMGDSIVRALDGVDLKIERGEFVAITGPSGSGKSTMMHLLGCLDRATSGGFVFDGRDVSDLTDRQLAAIRNGQIGFVFQTFNLMNRTSAVENVAVPLFYARKANTHGPARKALERVGLAERATHRSNELSGGERQRVAIARAIVNDPLLVLADEPTGNLDTHTGQQIMGLFRALNEQGVTVVLVTHEYEVAIQTRRIVQMRDGKIVSDRLTEDIRAEDGARGLRAWSSAAFGATQAEPAAAEPAGVAPPEGVSAEAGDVAALGPPKLARGANTALWLGVLGPLLVVAAIAIGLAGPSLEFRFDEPPPASALVRMIASSLAILAAVVLGAVAIGIGRRALRRVREEPANWLGTGRARAAVMLGWLAVLGPFVVGVLASLLSGSQGQGVWGAGASAG